MKWSLTITELEKVGACTRALEKLRPHFSSDEPIDPARAIELVGFWDVLYACKWLSPEHDMDLRMFACWCARQVLHIADDSRALAAIETSERFARGLASAEELEAARAAAMAAPAAWAAAAPTSQVQPWAASWGATWQAAAPWVTASDWDAAWDATESAQIQIFLAMTRGTAPWQIKDKS